jgi:hypothetical protein
MARHDPCTPNYSLTRPQIMLMAALRFHLGRPGADTLGRSAPGNESAFPLWQTSMNDVTRILADIERGTIAVAQNLLPLIYNERRRLVASNPTRVKLPARLSRQLHSLTTRICDWSRPIPESAGMAEVISSPRLTLDHAAKSMGISRAPAARQWKYAQVWSYDAINHDPPEGTLSKRGKASRTGGSPSCSVACSGDRCERIGPMAASTCHSQPREVWQ